MQRLGVQAIVTLPEEIDASNAGQIGEALLAIINRGASVVIADMTATVSCDHAGADAVVRAYQRAAVKGTQLRLVVPDQAVRRALSFTGLPRLVRMCPSLTQAVADGARANGAAFAAGQAQADQDLLDKIVRNLLATGLSLQDAIDMPGEPGRQRVADALQCLDDTIREIRSHALTRRKAQAGPEPPGEHGGHG